MGRLCFSSWLWCTVAEEAQCAAAWRQPVSWELISRSVLNSLGHRRY